MRAKHWKSNNFVIFQQGVGRKRGVEYRKKWDMRRYTPPKYERRMKRDPKWFLLTPFELRLFF